MRFKDACVGLLLACAVFPATAGLFVNDYLDLKDKDNGTTRAYVAGVGEGIFWVNVVLRQADAPRLYCPPDKLALGDENYINILDRAIAQRSNEGEDEDVPIEMLLLFGLMETFPCD